MQLVYLIIHARSTRSRATSARNGAKVIRNGAKVIRNGAKVIRSHAIPARNGARIIRSHATPARNSAIAIRSHVIPARSGARIIRSGATPARNGGPSVRKDLGNFFTLLTKQKGKLPSPTKQILQQTQDDNRMKIKKLRPDQTAGQRKSPWAEASFGLEFLHTFLSRKKYE
jgi:hypothetical protein